MTDQTPPPMPPVGTRVRLTGATLAAHCYGAVGEVVVQGPGRIDVRYPHNTTGSLRVVQVYRGEFRILGTGE